MTSISIEGLVKKHGAATAVDGIDLTVESGEMVVLLGPSGCGKTTTLRCVAGLETATDGIIRIGGEIVSSASHKLPPEERSIGMVFQSYALWPHMTAAENVAFGLKLRKLKSELIRARVAEALDLVGMKAYGERSAGELSGGQQQRVALARAIVLEPKILLFDEPLSNLDAKMRERMRVELRELQKRLGITAVYVTHDQQEAMVIADRIVLMRAGRIEQSGAARDIYRRPATRFAAEFIGSANVLVGRTEGVNGDTAVRIGPTALVPCGGVGLPAGTDVEIVLRPEAISLEAWKHAGALRSHSFPATVRKVLFLGNCIETELTIGDQTIRAQTSASEEWREHDQVLVSFDPTAVTVLRSHDH